MAKKNAVTKPARGTRDFLPDDLARRAYVTNIIREIYEAHGFAPLETPTFERLETLLGKYGEEGDQLVFKILRRGQAMVEGVREAGTFVADAKNLVVGRSGETAPGAEGMLADMGLRYDLTVPLARVVAEYDGRLPVPFKRYQIQPVWRADTPGKGRFREFYQCDVDVCGVRSMLVEAEVTGAVAACLVRLGFEQFKIRLNHRGLLRAFVQHAGIDLEKESDAIVAIDKLDKVGEDGVRKELATRGMTDAQADALMKLVLAGDDRDALRAALEGNETAIAALDEIDEVLRLSGRTPASGYLAFDPTLARGLGYYTGCIFEIAVEDLAGSLGGGGRYDGLVGMFLGREVPACGFSIGLERILVVMEQRDMFPADLTRRHVLLVTPDRDALDDTLQLAYALREAGCSVDLQPKAEKKIGKVRKRAEEAGFSFVVTLRGRGDAQVNVWSRAEPDVTDRMIDRETLAAHLLGSA
ncbi:MAG: histidine--tRNA ligase [Deltaproteobacteria bacterium]|jgi:histidyl-tRNA synthetase